jgi:hypothetical protein
MLEPLFFALRFGKYIQVYVCKRRCVDGQILQEVNNWWPKQRGRNTLIAGFQDFATEYSF